MKLTISNLTKTYRNGVQALNNVSLEIPPGMFGLLGPNGAGKSSLMRTIATLQEADQGTISLGDLNVLKDKDKVRQVLGYLPQEFGTYPKVSALDLLNHFAILKGLGNKRDRQDAVERLLHLTNLWDVRKKPLGGLSGGMKQRFGIAQALLGDPQLIIVDEPTAGLDPEERVRFHNLLSEIGEDVIVILSTHIVSDVSDLCANMAVINKGCVLLSGKPLEQMRLLEGKVWRRFIDKTALDSLKNQFNILSSRLSAGRLVVDIHSLSDPGDGFEPATPELEHVYFAAIKGFS